MTDDAPPDWVPDLVLDAGSRLRAMRRDVRDRLRIRRADGVVVSFPKSGRTWVRVMLSRLIQIRCGLRDDALIDFDNLAALSPAAPRLLFTHDDDAMRPPERLTRDKARYLGRPVSLLVRHPADAVISRHFHLRHRSADPARRRLAQLPIDRFVWSERGGVPTAVAFLNNWAAAARANPHVLVQRYEDFQSAPDCELARLSVHFGLGDQPAAIADAVAFGAFGAMRAREAAGFFASARMQPGRPQDERSFKTRRGRAGGWRETLSEANVALVDSHLQANLDPTFGYVVQASAPPDSERARTPDGRD